MKKKYFLVLVFLSSGNRAGLKRNFRYVGNQTRSLSDEYDELHVVLWKNATDY